MHELLHESDPAGRYGPPPAAHHSPDAWTESLAMAVHDLGNAMAVVHGTVQLWRRGARLHTSPAADWASVHAASDRAVRLSRELLDLCRARHSRFQLDCRPVELAGLVAAVADRRRPAFEAAGLGLRVEVPPPPGGPVWVPADRERLERVLDNLLDNAVKYTPDGGHVTVGVDARGGRAVVRVRDTGVGIPPEFLPRVFEPFAREDSPAVRDQPGSGVGLLAVRRIVEMHGGRVEVASPGRGRGSEFTVELPVITARPAAADEPAPAAVAATC